MPNIKSFENINININERENINIYSYEGKILFSDGVFQ